MVRFVGETSEEIGVRGCIIQGRALVYHFGKEPGHLEGGTSKCICGLFGSGCNEKRQKTLLELHSIDVNRGI